MLKQISKLPYYILIPICVSIVIATTLLSQLIIVFILYSFNNTYTNNSINCSQYSDSKFVIETFEKNKSYFDTIKTKYNFSLVDVYNGDIQGDFCKGKAKILLIGATSENIEKFNNDFHGKILGIKYETGI